MADKIFDPLEEKSNNQKIDPLEHYFRWWDKKAQHIKRFKCIIETARLSS